MTAVAREQSYGPIQAYAKLQGENFVYYVQTLELTLGRRVDGYTDVQVDLGPSRTISRQHAKIVYDFTSRRFMLHPLGKNGVAVNGHHYKPGAVIPLETKTAIQIGEVCFYFLLPIGNVSQSVKPVAKAPALQLGQLYSRSPSPTDTLTRPNSSIPTRVHSSYNSRSASPIQGGADDFAAQLTERLAPLASSGGDPPAKMPKAEPMAAPQHTPNTGRALARSRPNSKRTSKTASTSVASSFIPAPPPADLAALPDDEPWRDDPTQKPPYSYATLIAQAIWSQPDGKMTLAGIYNYIMTTYKYYDMEDPSGWQNSIRHNLSLNKAFIRVARGPNEPGKGAFWSIDPKCADNLKAGLYRRRSRGPKNATGKVSSVCMHEFTYICLRHSLLSNLRHSLLSNLRHSLLSNSFEFNLCPHIDGLSFYITLMGLCLIASGQSSTVQSGHFSP
eukprot:TRINITY_DN12225_c5_g2_i1.p1 TRINITY_DN12225_c5_g2~~TRINITY_DN12225_c5_g2_i1.p1  ORF type:complete len:446 (+),score=30.81 TRINITY_DN12225_c5_g2_i1:158-1495(+)